MNTKSKMARSVGVILLIASIAIFFFGDTLFSSKVESKYQEILGDYNEESLTQIVGIGSTSEYRFRSYEILEYNQKSVGERYALDDVVFTPLDDWLTPWECEGKPKNWRDSIAQEDMKYFMVYVDISIPNDPTLEGKTINGVLEMKLIYPIQRGYDVFSNENRHVWVPLSIHIFTADELTELSELRGQMEMGSWIPILSLVMGFAGIGILYIVYVNEKN